MRRGLLIVMLLAGGCCAHQHGATTQPASSRPPVHIIDAPASALAFDAPAGAANTVSLAREPRVPRAFIGYESGVAEFLYVRTDDRVLEFGGWRGYSGTRDRFERRAISTRVGLLNR